MTKVHFRDYARADFRIISKILSVHHKEKNPSPQLMLFISNLYIKKGGSWVLFFDGDPRHCVLLKRVVKAVMKRKNKK